ncbi:M1 family metallopeptidase [Flavobacteriaceae bacterium]|nr:M1 family metallopeptidase [Flavobacteriaceae bacterium]MDA9318823.1 M1 family metallopeptidase [Flavobacteriaceae bacterium]MDB0042419.1 M1 family metallopeptidase [Flavobacteriaceae bacterium]MDB4093303.1 M1 family metallopeptidase [Flavobacteriaceae bacterium]MDB9793584.1 M1 family metallopeptidase [Flavobacteriaceae bacterium]|tara:strand:- start:2352 stop:4001 length:1650 start_codon:yes stop_codon:yes gene_type:complete
MKKILILLLLSPVILFSQGIMDDKTEFSRQDTLRGSITKERSWWDLNRYHLDISVKPEEKFISGSNKISYTVLKSHDLMQIDLQTPLILTKAIQDNSELEIIHDGNAHFIKLKKKQNVGSKEELIVYYEGNPRVAVRAPWDGGISWEKDKNGNHFIASSCQGLGASVWWPNKDHMYDEPESMLMSVNVPKGLTNVSNGRLVKIDKMSDSTTFHWEVVNPINNYGVNINIGDYVNFSEIYEGEKGDLDMDYYVLSYNLEKAKVHFVDAIKTMQAFEYWFGPYPFYEDSFKLVEAPYLGMEHQSSVTYGNKYRKGYLGRDLSGTGWGLKFDYIIIHETGHEWFANNITYKDIADMWVHEGFTTYSENLFVDYHFGKKASSEYVIGTRRGIGNKKPIIGPYNVNKGGSGDMYSKGANLLHTLRQVAGNDKVWRNVLRGLNKDFYHKTVTTYEIENYISEKMKINLKPFFNQYLRDIRIPVLEHNLIDGKMSFRWNNVIEGFKMPIDLIVTDHIAGNEEKIRIFPTQKWKSKKLKGSIEIDKNYYVDSKYIIQ